MKWAVVLAGGEGQRLQSLTQFISGDTRPKQFCPIFGGKSLLAHTCERIAPSFDQDRTLYVLTRAHESHFRRELAGVDERQWIVQPSNRGTALAIAVCAQSIVTRDEDALIGFFPSDHHYLSCAAFRSSVETGVEIAGQYPHRVLMLGAEPRYPEVEYGWIEPGRAVDDLHPVGFVSRFWEKPDLRRARQLQQQGCLWNTFVTIGLASAFRDLLQAAVPELVQSVETAGDCWEQLYRNIAPADFSRDVLQRVPQRLLVLRDSASGWTDLGSPRRVIDALPSDAINPELRTLTFSEGVA